VRCPCRQRCRRGAGFGGAVIIGAVAGSPRVGWALDVAPLSVAWAFETALEASSREASS
jgi:hypothetical protein